MQRNRQCLAALALAVLAPLSASAADSGFYFGGAFGNARFKAHQSDFDDLLEFAIDDAGGSVLDIDSDLDKKDTKLDAFIGYRLNPFFAIEAGYTDLGKLDYDAQATTFVSGAGVVNLDGSMSIESDGIALSGLGTLPLSEQFDLYARLGVFFSKTKFEVSFNGFSDSVSGKDEDVFAGLGAGWNINANWTARLEYQRFKKVGKKNTTGEGDVDTATLGVLFRL